ncbi:MAG: hypothetical protein V3U29_05495 [Phycisphaeraceae bacterium]
MLKKIAPGSRVTVKVVKHPANAAATKTIVRLLSKDHAVKAQNQRLRDIRATRNKPTRRGGRIWISRLVKQRPVRGRVGESGTITATLDVLQDLRSVNRFVEVAKA